MMARRGVLGLASAGAVLLLTGCEPGDVGSNHLYFEPVRYRLTAEVETPAGVKTGSSVIQTVWDRGLSGATVTGEAVAVDLPDGETLFVLLRTKADVEWAGGPPGVKAPKSPEPEIPPEVRAGGVSAENRFLREARRKEVKHQLDWIRANREVHYLWGGDASSASASGLPYIVRFRNIADPKSVEEVSPDNLGKAFGVGVTLKSLTVQMTDEPVTTGIEKRLDWLRAMRGSNLDGSKIVHFEAPLSGQIGTGDFLRGKK